MIRTLLRQTARQILQFYPIEYGKYSILQRLYFPFLAPAQRHMEAVKMRAGFTMQLTPTELLQAHLYLFSTYELPTTRFIARYLKNNDVVLDIGANIGYISMFCANAIGKGGKIYAFEPERNNYAALQQHIALNSFTNIYPQRLAATSIPTTLRLYLASDNYGAHSTIFNPDVLTQEYEEVQGITLDNFVQEQNIADIALVKIDVEGAEHEVLQGMKTILSKHRPVLVIELNETLQQQRGLSSDAIKQQLLNENNYTIFSTDERGFLRVFVCLPKKCRYCRRLFVNNHPSPANKKKPIPRTSAVSAFSHPTAITLLSPSVSLFAQHSCGLRGNTRPLEAYSHPVRS
jgi:FkbM family methyltransferase